MLLNKTLSESAERILDLQKYIQCLHKKLSLLRIGYATKSEKEKNDIALDEYETIVSIRSREKQLAKMKKVFEQQILNPYLLDVSQVLENYECAIDEAKKFQEKDFEMKHLLYSVNWKSIDESFEKRIELYKEIKLHLEKKKDE